MIRAYSVYDTEKEMYSNPIYTEDSDAKHVTAIRVFKAQLFDRTNLLALFPDKFELRFIGMFDDKSGAFVNEEIETVITGSAALEEMRNDTVQK